MDGQMDTGGSNGFIGKYMSRLCLYSETPDFSAGGGGVSPDLGSIFVEHARSVVSV